MTDRIKLVVGAGARQEEDSRMVLFDVLAAPLALETKDVEVLFHVAAL